MRDEDIQTIFNGLIDKIGEVDDGTYQMFELLVRTTLRCRDELHAVGKTLTVGETQEALDAFIGVMKSKTLPEGLSDHAHQLLVEWLEELKKSRQH